MKREYMKPNMAIVNIQCRKMLTTSTLGFGGNRTTAADADAPGFNDFDDFDE